VTPDRLPAGADVVVVGSGIVGAATAAALASRGARVVLVDKEDGPGREGSGRAQGSLRVQGRHGSELALAREALGLWTEAAADGGAFELVHGGNLYLQTRPEEADVLRGLLAESHAAGLTSVELLDAAQVRALVPAVSGELLGGMWSPVDAQCQPDLGTAFWAAKAQRLGVSTAYGVKATRVRTGGGRTTGVETSAGAVAADAVVVAAGVWTPYLTRTAGLDVPIMPVVMSELETAPVPPQFAATLRAFGFGARQRPGGQVVVSAGLNARVRHGVSLADLHGLRWWAPRALSFRKAIRLNLDVRRTASQVRHRSTFGTALVPAPSPEPPVDARLVDSSLARLARVVPGLAGAKTTRRWGGLVDMTPDGLPVVDAGSGPDGLVVVAGLCGHGFTLGPALGETAADLALTGRTDRDVEAFSLARFAGRRVAQPSMMI
jgi:glycine/D-amino acid oxidase-like deaminating enzyme